MNILMPMAGAGKRFSDAGYSIPKPLIPTTERRDGKKYPMVVCAMRDVVIDQQDPKLTFIIRTDYDEDIRPGILEYYPDASFIGVDHLTEGQACTCLLARDIIDNDEPLLIAGCDCCMVYEAERFINAQKDADVLVFTYRNNDAVLINPNAYGWMKTDGDTITDVSVKKPISDNPMNDHAVAASFWFRRGSDFVKSADEMIAANDRINNEFYVDQVIAYCLKNGLNTKVFEIDRYIGLGTPEDYERYEKTIEYWRGFTGSSAFLGQ